MSFTDEGPRRIIMTTASRPLYLAYHYYQGVSQLEGLEVQGFDHSDQFNNFYTKHLFNKVRHKVFPQYIYGQISQRLEKLVEDFRPNILWIFKGMEIQPQTLERIRQRNCYLVNYNLDHPFDFASRGSGNENVLNTLTLYDLHISYSHEIIKQLENRIPGVSTAYLPFGYALEDKVYDNVKATKEVNAVCFIGEPDSHRAQFIKTLVAQDVSIHVYGRNWSNFLSPAKNLTINPPAYGEDYWRTLRRYRVQLNIFRPHNKNAHNMRSYEIPAVGGLMLAPKTTEHLAAFQSNQEAFFYESQEDVFSKVNQLLAMSTKDAERIRSLARNRSVVSGYSYTRRAQQALQILKDGLSSR